jgi:hypothetical protein
LFGPDHWHCRIHTIKPKGNISLFPGTFAPELPVHAQPDFSTILMLQDLLRDACHGKIQAIAVSYLDENNKDWRNWTGGGRTTIAALLGGMRLLEEEMARKANEWTDQVTKGR